METAIISSDVISLPAHMAMGFCSVKHVGDNNNNIYPEESIDIQQESFSNPLLDLMDIDDMPVILSDANICQDTLHISNSSVWIDPSRSPFVYNFYGPPTQSGPVIEKADCITFSDYNNIQSLSSYIDQDKYYYDELSPSSLEDNRISGAENIASLRIFNEEIQEGQGHVNSPEIVYEDMDSESEMFLSELKNKKTNKDPENGVLKQLMSKDIQSTSRQQKTIMFVGEDSSSSQTIHTIRFTDPRIKCSAMEVDHEEIVEDTPTQAPRKKKYQCDECKQIFHQLTEFRKHLNENNNIKNYKNHKTKRNLACSHCGKKFSNCFKYKRHIDAHGDPDLECPKCHKVYASKSTLKVHLKIHDRKYPCAYCSKSFAIAEPYKKHLKRHCKFVCMFDGCMFIADSEAKLDKHHDEHNEIYNDDEHVKYDYTEKQFEDNAYDVNDNHIRSDATGHHLDEYENVTYFYSDHDKNYNCPDGYYKNYNEEQNLKTTLKNIENIDFTNKEFEQGVHLESDVKVEMLGKENNNNEVNVSDDAKIGVVSTKRKYLKKSIESNKEYDMKKQADSVISKVISEKVFLADSKTAKTHVKKCKSCNMCSKSFDRLSDLKRHLIEHVVKATLAEAVSSEKGTLRIVCQVCEKEDKIVTFSAIDKYKHHLREHAKLTIYKCGICDKPFSDSSNFSKHKKIHSNSYYQCDLCHRKFNSKVMLIKHMELHNKSEPLKCKMCRRVFHFQSMLNKHVKAAHERPAAPRYCCTFCGEALHSLRDRWEHEWLVHNIRKTIADCEMCSSKFRKFSDLKRHCSERHDVTLPPQKKLRNKKYMQNIVCVQTIT